MRKLIVLLATLSACGGNPFVGTWDQDTKPADRDAGVAVAILVEGKVPLYHPLGGNLQMYEPDEARRLMAQGYVPQSAEEARAQRRAAIEAEFYDSQWLRCNCDIPSEISGVNG